MPAVTYWILVFDLNPLLVNNSGAIKLRIWISENACNSLTVMHTNRTPVTTNSCFTTAIDYQPCTFAMQEQVETRNTCVYNCMCDTTCQTLAVELGSKQPVTVNVCELEWYDLIV